MAKAEQRPRMNRPPRSRARATYEYRRAYKACIPCRQRKAKCEVPDRLDRPCARCEKKNIPCQFIAKRPWTRAKEEPDQQGIGLDRGSAGVVERGGESGERSPHGVAPTADGVAATVLHTMVSSSNDALDILFQAAAHEVNLPASKGGNPAVGNTRDGPEARPAKPDVLRVWNACRFVRMGWFTATEAINLVEFFFRNMSPLSPILPDFYALPDNHYWLVTQEPMLCCTILMISSRYYAFPGTDGTSRGYFIHHRLWQHCQHLILRIILGQEKSSKAKTRHLGTIEALLLLSEWYPRAINFPPENDGWDSDLMFSMPDRRDPPLATEDSPISERWKQDVVEPTRRAGRMSWMLVTSALALAHELGVFRPHLGVQVPRVGDGASKGLNPAAYLDYLQHRYNRIPSLLFVFVNLLASQIGCTSPMTEALRVEGSVAALPDGDWRAFMTAWVELTKLTKMVTEGVFVKESRIDVGGRESSLVKKGRSGLLQWKRPTLAETSLNHILEVEYQYLRVFTNSIEMQAFVEQMLSQQPDSRRLQPNCSHDDQAFIKEVIDGSCEILQRVTLILQDKPVKCLPGRIVIRVISSSVFLIKALTLGVGATKLRESLDLLDRTIRFLTASAPTDDMHLVSRYAALLETHVARLRDISKAQAENLENSLLDHGRYELNEGQGEFDPGFFNVEDWFSLPLDPMMAPFGEGDDAGYLGMDFDSSHLDFDFMWNLPP